MRFYRQKVFQRALHRDGARRAVRCTPLIELTLKGTRQPNIEGHRLIPVLHYVQSVSQKISRLARARRAPPVDADRRNASLRIASSVVKTFSA